MPPIRLCSCAVLLAACQPAELPGKNTDGAVASPTVAPQTVVLREVFNSRQCQITTAGVTVIDNLDSWQQWYSTNTRRLTFSTTSTIDAELAVAPTVDFDRQQVLIVAMGRQSSAGYWVSLQADQLVIDGPVGHIPVHWKTPPPGSLQAQLLTSPCMAVVSGKLSYISQYQVQIQR